MIGDDYPYHISHHWAQPYRYMRIKEVLESKEKFSLQDMKDLQMDKKNLYAEEFLKPLLEQLETAGLNETEQAAADLLGSWNMTDDKELAAPLCFIYG